jgi:N-terminal acetyltransferase B complex non-catalytic subunit
VLAQASKLNEVKTGRPLKGYAPSANGSHNGHTKKDEDAPLVKEAPSYATEFFKGEQIIKLSALSSAPTGADMEARFEAAHAHRSACDALHVATITQEVKVTQ